MSTTTTDFSDKLAAYERSCRLGTDWLLGQMNDDGSIGPAEEPLFYYRVPWTFALMGEVSAAAHHLDWIKRHMFTKDGAFEGVSPLGFFADRYGSYPLAILLIGAALMQRFDVVYPGTRRLLSWQDTETGGFYANARDRSADAEQELAPTCQGGLTLLMLGQIDAALKVGHFLKRLRAAQPDFDHRLYQVFNRSKGLITTYAPDDALWYVTRKDDPWQQHFNAGIAAAFLAQLHMATGEVQWLDLARQFQAFSMTTDPCQFQSMQLCKSGWGSGLLHVATREDTYRDWTVRIGDWFLEHQYDDGHWENTKKLTPNPTVADNIHVTVEFVMHVGNIRQYLA